jgi:hypothetical protein
MCYIQNVIIWGGGGLETIFHEYKFFVGYNIKGSHIHHVFNWLINNTSYIICTMFITVFTRSLIFLARMVHYLSLSNWKLNEDFVLPTCCFTLQNNYLHRIRIHLVLIVGLLFQSEKFACSPCYYWLWEINNYSIRIPSNRKFLEILLTVLRIWNRDTQIIVIWKAYFSLKEGE